MIATPASPIGERATAGALLLDALPGCLVLAALLAMWLRTFQEILHGEMGDPDGYMVLAHLRSVLTDGGWNAGLFMRDNAPYGMVLHWTKAHDLVVLALAAPFAAIGGWSTSLAIAGAIVGPVTIVALIYAAIWAAAPVSDTPTRRFAGMLLALAPLVQNYGMAGNASHHMTIVVAWVVFVGCAVRVILRRGRADGIAAGIAAAIALWFSFECILALSLTVAAMGLVWIRDGGSHRTSNLWFAGLFALALVVLLVLDPPHEGLLFPDADRLSIVYVVFAALLTILWGAIATAPQAAQAWRARLVVALVGTAICGVVMMLAFPKLVTPGQAFFGEELGSGFWADITEMVPAFEDPAMGVLQMAGPFIGFCIAAGFALERGPAQGRIGWAYLAVAIALLMVPGVLHVRLAIYPQVLAVVPSAALMGRVPAIMDRLLPESLRMLGRSLAITFLAVTPLLIPIAFSKVVKNGAAAAADTESKCGIRHVAKALNDAGYMGGQNLILMTHPNRAPETLYWTEHRVVAGLYHRNIQGLSDMMGVIVAKDDAKARAILEKRGVSYLLVCADAAPAPASAKKDDEPAVGPARLRDLHTGRHQGAELYNRLRRGEVPGWLQPKPWPAGIETDLRLFKIVR